MNRLDLKKVNVRVTDQKQFIAAANSGVGVGYMGCMVTASLHVRTRDGSFHGTRQETCPPCLLTGGIECLFPVPGKPRRVLRRPLFQKLPRLRLALQRAA